MKFSKFERERFLEGTLLDLSAILYETFEVIPVLVGEYAIYYYFKHIIHRYSTFEFDFSKVELLLPDTCFSSLQEILCEQGYTFFQNDSFLKDGILFQFEPMEKHELNLEFASLMQRTPSFPGVKDKKVQKVGKFFVPNFENLKKYFFVCKDKEKLQLLESSFEKEILKYEKEKIKWEDWSSILQIMKRNILILNV